MKKIITFFLLIFSLYFLETSGRNCSSHGFEENGNCICGSFWKGLKCEIPHQIEEFSASNYNESNFYDWTEISIQKRIEKLYNILPDSNQNVSDPMFPENSSSFKVENVSAAWQPLREAVSNTTLWGSESLKIVHSVQGSLRDCYIFAVLASIVAIDGEKIIKAAIPYVDEEHAIYVTRWFLFGRYIYVSVNEYVPTLDGALYGAQVKKNGCFWAAILEKAWAKIWGSYKAITDTTEELFVSALTGSPLGKKIKISEIFGENFDYLNDISTLEQKLKISLIKENFTNSTKIDETSINVEENFNKSNDTSLSGEINDISIKGKIFNKSEDISFKKNAIERINIYEKQIFLGKTLPDIEYLISNHFFSILKVYDLILVGKKQYGFSVFQLYNPWGIDLTKNVFPKLTEKKLNGDKFLKKKFNLTNAKNEIDDGKFLIISDDLISNFERFTVFDPLVDYEIVSQLLSLNSDIKTDFMINLKLENLQENDKIYFQFNLLNIEFIDNQIQHFKIKDLIFNPEPEHYTSHLGQFQNIANFSDFKVKSTYVGGYYSVQNTSNDYNMSFTIEKYNYDVYDKVYLTFNVPKNSFSFINVTKNAPIDICPNNCSSHGECNISSKTCFCDSNHFGKACTLKSSSKSYETKENNGCDQSVSFLLSSGKCKCFPGYELINSNCEKCEDDKKSLRGNCMRYKNSCWVEYIQNACRKTCMTGTCFIPAAQTSCQVNGCFGRGLCMLRGYCIKCFFGFTGTFCQNMIW